MRRVQTALFKDQLGYLTDQLRDRRLSTAMAPKALTEARCCQSVRKFLFPFARALAKCGKNGPSIHVHWGTCVRQMPIVLRVRSSFGRAGEPTKALKWGRRTNRTGHKALWTHSGRCSCINASATCYPRQNENRYAWADEGLVANGKLFSFSRCQTFCQSPAGRSDGRRTCSFSKFSPSEFRVCRH